MTASEIPSSSRTALSGFSIWVGAKATFSRISTEAVLCDSPTTIMFIFLIASFLFVAVQPRQEKVHAEEGEQEHEKADDGKDGRLLPPPAGGEPAVEERRVDEPGDERPGLLRVPAPVRSPGGLG